MKKLEQLDGSSIGASFLVYGPTGCGKTGAALTCPGPICFINVEEKDPRLVHSQIGIPEGLKIDYYQPDSFDDLEEFLNSLLEQVKEGKLDYKTVFFDGLTFGQSNFKAEIEDARKTERVAKNDYRSIIDRTRLDKGDWDVLNSFMLRVTKLLISFNKYGLVSVATSIDIQEGYRRYGGGIRTAPYLQGIVFPRLLPGLFDFMGYIVKPFSYIDGKPVPARVSFVSLADQEGDTFLARCSSSEIYEKTIKHGPAPLDFQRIMAVLRK
jgi:hypothetical protein